MGAHDDETEPGAITRRSGQPDRRVIDLFDHMDEGELSGVEISIGERV
jgi:hypothetical protein